MIKDQIEYRQMEEMNSIIYENFIMMKADLETLDLQIKYAKLKKSKKLQVYNSINTKSCEQAQVLNLRKTDHKNHKINADASLN